MKIIKLIFNNKKKIIKYLKLKLISLRYNLFIIYIYYKEYKFSTLISPSY